MLRDNKGKFLDIRPFNEVGRNFMKNGFYCAEPTGSSAWYDFWFEERRKCIEGYEEEDVKITGDHYFYLNYCPIQKVEDTNKKKSKKIKGFPDFWDGDYTYFWCREIARNGISEEDYNNLYLKAKIKEEFLNGGYNLIVGKSRRKGYSYKSAAIATKNYFHIPYSLTIFAAYDKKYLYPKGVFSMAMDYINFVNTHTAWNMPSDVINKPNAGHIKASYIEYNNGIRVEKGFQSEILSLTFKDNPDAARGKDAYDIFFEESGAFGTPGLLKDSYISTQDCVMAGDIKTGMITIYGTSGDLESGTVDYANMFERPESFGFLPFVNIWDDKTSNQLTGFFHPVNLNMEGFYDENGNSFEQDAKENEIQAREKLINKGATSSELQRRMQEKPLGPSEAFASASTNTFPTMELKNQLDFVKSNNYQSIKGTPVELYYQDGIVVAKPILDGSATPITSYYNVPTDTKSAVVIYEHPVYNPPKGLYKIGYDPVRQDNGTSLAAYIVYKSVHIGSSYSNIIVAEYIGRLENTDDIDNIGVKLAEFYNTTIMHENEITSVKNYYRRIKKLHLLALQPDNVISKVIKKSKVSRVYGCHMTSQLKDAGERYIKDWLLDIADYDEHGNPVYNYQRIYSIRLLEELLNYNRNGNFDLISALIMCMMQVQEETLDKKYDKEAVKNKTAKQLLDMMNKLYRNDTI